MNTDPIVKTPDLKDNVSFRLKYKEIYLRLKRLIENGNAENKKENVKDSKKNIGQGMKGYGPSEKKVNFGQEIEIPDPHLARVPS